MTAVEAFDSILAFRLAKFKLYAKPGGSTFLVNDPLDRALVGDPGGNYGETLEMEEGLFESVKELWTRHGIRWGTFQIHMVWEVTLNCCVCVCVCVRARARVIVIFPVFVPCVTCECAHVLCACTCITLQYQLK